ncbi:MAG TPA: hypothetical protein VMV72_08705 [Verrucomicrobiae bacterium]|nr:hypothetical protein [Verrucomicrobiae bacterium]
MKRSFWICALLWGAVVGQPTLSRGQNTSPVGTWQVTILGSQKGVLMMAFSNNNNTNTVTGYGISRKQFGFITLSGSWGFNSKGDVVAAYVQNVGTTSTAYTFTAKMLPSGQFQAKAISHGSGSYVCKGEQPTSFPNLSGTWNATLKRKGKIYSELFAVSASTNYPYAYDVTGTGLSEAGSFTLSGSIIASAEDKVNAAVARTFGTDVQNSSLSGVFKSKHSRMMLSGSDDTGAHLSESAVR